jgi:hypothetical protein
VEAASEIAELSVVVVAAAAAAAAAAAVAAAVAAGFPMLPILQKAAAPLFILPQIQ